MNFRVKIAPIPDALLYASCKDVMLWPEIQRLTCDFAVAVKGQSKEHLLQINHSGKIRHKKGTSKSVGKIFDVKGLIFFEIHNHPNPKNQAEAFLHPTDLGASFLGTNQCFSTTAMLLQIPGAEHVVSARFKPAQLRKLLKADKTVLESLDQSIKCLHTTTRGQWFCDRVMRSQTIFDLARLYREEFPMLDFEIFEMNISKRKLKLR